MIEPKLKVTPNQRVDMVPNEHLECVHCRKRGVIPIESAPALIQPKGIVIFVGRPQFVFVPKTIIAKTSARGIILIDFIIGVVRQINVMHHPEYNRPPWTRWQTPIEECVDRMKGARFDTVHISQEITVYVKNTADQPISCELHLEGDSADFDNKIQ